jgi:hypothetical protein
VTSDTVKVFVDTIGAGGDGGLVGAGVERVEAGVACFGGGRRTWIVYPGSPFTSTTGAELLSPVVSISENLDKIL